MVQNAKEAPAPDYDGIWDELTTKQQMFVEGILAGKTQVQAYRDAYDVGPGTKDTSVYVSASREANKAKVALCIAVTRHDHAAFTLEEHDRALRRIALKAEKEGKYVAAINAYAQLAKGAGLYVELRKDITETDPKETLADIARSSPRLANVIASELGIPFKAVEPDTDTDSAPTDPSKTRH